RVPDRPPDQSELLTGGGESAAQVIDNRRDPGQLAQRVLLGRRQRGARCRRGPRRRGCRRPGCRRLAFRRLRWERCRGHGNKLYVSCRCGYTWLTTMSAMCRRRRTSAAAAVMALFVIVSGVLTASLGFDAAARPAAA